MTINVHEQSAAEYVDKGYVETGRRHYDGFDRIDFADPESYCLHRMRPWKSRNAEGVVVREQHGFCLLDKDHKGRHATVVHWCDVCGKSRRGDGQAYSHEDVTVCWFCRNVLYTTNSYRSKEQAHGSA